MNEGELCAYLIPSSFRTAIRRSTACMTAGPVTVWLTDMGANS